MLQVLLNLQFLLLVEFSLHSWNCLYYVKLKVKIPVTEPIKLFVSQNAHSKSFPSTLIFCLCSRFLFDQPSSSFQPFSYFEPLWTSSFPLITYSFPVQKQVCRPVCIITLAMSSSFVADSSIREGVPLRTSSPLCSAS